MGDGFIPDRAYGPVRRISEDTKKILIIHDNKIDQYTQKAHEIGKMIDEIDGYKAVIDKDYWKPCEETSLTETNNREKEMVKEADGAYRFIAPSSQTNEPRHEGSLREVRKVVNAGKPLLEHYFQNAHDSPNRPIPEKNYGKRVLLRTEKGEHVKEKIQKKLDEVFNDNS